MILFQTIFRKCRARGLDWITISFADLPSISHIAPWQNNSVEIPLRANMLLQMWSRRLLWHTLTVAGNCSTASYCGCHGRSGTESKPRSITVILSYNTMLSMIFWGFFYFYSYTYVNICYSCHITIFTYFTMTMIMCLQYWQLLFQGLSVYATLSGTESLFSKIPKVYCTLFYIENIRGCTSFFMLPSWQHCMCTCIGANEYWHEDVVVTSLGIISLTKFCSNSSSKTPFGSLTPRNWINFYDDVHVSHAMSTILHEGKYWNWSLLISPVSPWLNLATDLFDINCKHMAVTRGFKVPRKQIFDE